MDGRANGCIAPPNWMIFGRGFQGGNFQSKQIIAEMYIFLRKRQYYVPNIVGGGGGPDGVFLSRPEKNTADFGDGE